MTNWDPAIIKDGDVFGLFWAPSDTEQFIATSKSSNPTDVASWSTPARVTIALYRGASWWDFRPDPFKKGISEKGSLGLVYTSEGSNDGKTRINANIWRLITVPLIDK